MAAANIFLTWVAHQSPGLYVADEKATDVCSRHTLY